MKWKEQHDYEATNYIGRRNNIKFIISENREGFCYVICRLVEDENMILNSLWVRDEFKTLEDTKRWCEKLTQGELLKLRELGLKKQTK